MLDLFQAIGGNKIAIMTDIASERTFIEELTGKVMEQFSRMEEVQKREFLTGIIPSACDVLCRIRGYNTNAETPQLFVPFTSPESEGDRETGQSEPARQETQERDDMQGEPEPSREEGEGEPAPQQGDPQPPIE